jgi:lambda family phage tail tape measure protein
VAGAASKAYGAIRNLTQGKKALEAGKGGAIAADIAIGAGTATAAVGATAALFGGEEEYNKAKDNANKSGEAQKAAARKVVDALKSQKEAIKGVSDAYEENTAKVLLRIQDETKMINMTEKGKEALRTRTQVEQDAANQIARLEEMRFKSSGKLTEEINREIAKIKERRDQVISQLDEEINKKHEALRIDNERVKSMEAMFDIQNKVKDLQDQYLLDTLSGIEKQLKQIEVQERKVRDAAIQRFDVENRNLPPSEFAARREAEYNRLNAVFDETVKKQQAAAKEGYAQSRTFENGWTKAFKEYVDNATNAAQAAQRVFQKATQGMEDLIINFAKTGKFEFKGFMNSILEELLRSQVRSLMAQIFNLSGKSATNAGGLLGGSIIPGFLAQGGSAMAGMPYVVGENGPEMFVPNQSGTVIPNNQLAGASTYVTYNINAVDAMSFKQMVAADPSFIYAVSQQGAKSIPQTRR